MLGLKMSAGTVSDTKFLNILLGLPCPVFEVSHHAQYSKCLKIPSSFESMLLTDAPLLVGQTKRLKCIVSALSDHNV